MSFERVVEKSRRVVRVTVIGDSDVETSLAEIDATANDLAANPGFGLIVDLLASTNLPTRDEVETIVAAIARRKSAFAVGVGFVVGEDVQRGVARMASIVGDLRGLKIDVFRTVDDAAAWLAR